jgi:hypothetical protein
MNNRLFFYCLPSEPIDYAPYQHAIVSLGEGLAALGFELVSNINYWMLSPYSEEYLFKYCPGIRPDDCYAVVLNEFWPLLRGQLPGGLFHPARKYKTIYLDHADGVNTSAFQDEFRQFDFIFRSHMCTQFEYPSNFRPSVFGLSNRIIQSTAHYTFDAPERSNQILLNFKHHQKYPHSLRRYVEKHFLPGISQVLDVNTTIDPGINITDLLDETERLFWIQTGTRHRLSYYQRLRSSSACAAFGGFFEGGWPKDKSRLLSRLQRRLLMEMLFKTGNVSQWDSWRFWESLAAGCATFHLDFEKYGFQLPEPPINWKHYIGVDLDNIQDTFDRIADQPNLLSKIGQAGREWALENYSPIAIAENFLRTIEIEPSQSHAHEALPSPCEFGMEILKGR